MVSLEDDSITPITEEDTPSASRRGELEETESWSTSRATSETTADDTFQRREDRYFRLLEEEEDDGRDSGGTRHGIYLDEPPPEFPVSIQKDTEDTSLSLEMDASDGMTLLVKRVWPGPVRDWNKTHRGMQHDVRPFDRIVEVNDVRGDNKDLMKELMRRGSHVEMMIRRPKEFRIEVSRADRTDSLGIVFVKLGKPDHEVLLVTRIEEEGLIAKWNKFHWQFPVRKNDRVIQVNAVRGNAKKLLDVLLNEENLKIVLEH